MERSHRGYSHKGVYIQELPARRKKGLVPDRQKEPTRKPEIL